MLNLTLTLTIVGTVTLTLALSLRWPYEAWYFRWDARQCWYYRCGAQYECYCSWEAR